MSYVGLWTVIN